MGTRPSGTVTFLFTDVEGSTRLWDECSESMRVALPMHDEIVRRSIDASGGVVFATGGDGFAAAFHRAGDAVAAAEDLRSALVAAPWPSDAVLRVRVGVHTGQADERGRDYFGPAVNRAARIMAVAHGGQVLLSDVTARLAGGGFVDLGEHRLKDLSAPERLWQVGPGSFPRLRSLDIVRHNLPVSRTELIGRFAEVEQVKALLVSDRLVTLTGIGGVGKTRLALAAAGQLTDRFSDGVFFVDLSPLTEGRRVVTAVSDAVGVPLDSVSVGERSPIAQLCRVVAARRMLIVLDNCEHLLDDVAGIVDELLVRGDQVHVLATSRESLEVEGERTYRVPSLSYSDDDGSGGDVPAVELLIGRARAANGGFSPNMAEREVLRRICAQLDGIPLAIELAAVQLRHLTPADLSRMLDDRFRMLVGGPRRQRQRQQTLQAMMDWSWGLLSDDERGLLAELSVFAGGFALPVAGAVCASGGRDVVAAIGSLMAKSLVIADENRWGSRYRLLETVRLYGQLKLVEREDADRLRSAHAAWYVAWLDGWSFQDQWASAELASQLRADLENVRAAVEWLTDQQRNDDLAAIVRSCTFLWRENVAPQDALDWSSRVDVAALDDGSRARVFLASADAVYANGDYDGMRARAARARDAAVAAGSDDVAAAAMTIMSQGLAIPEPERAIALLEEAARRAERAGANRVEAIARTLLAAAGANVGWTLEQQLASCQRGVDLCGPDGWDHNNCHGNAAFVRLQAGQPGPMIATARRLARSSDELGLPLEAARSWLDLAYAAAEALDEPACTEGLGAAHRRYRDAGVDRGLADVLLGMAMREAFMGSPETAAALLSTTATGLLIDQGSYAWYRRCRDRIRAAGLPTAVINAARHGGRLKTVEQAIAEHLNFAN